MLFRKKALLSLGTPSDRSHGTAFADLLHFLYQYEAAFDVPAQSRFILALTCGVCRSLLRVSVFLPSMLDLKHHTSLHAV